MAGDSAYGLAAQYIAAKANYAVNAGQCPAATTAINDAQTLLAGIEFDGTGTYFKVKGNKIADINGYTSSMANALAGILDDYNNGIVCPSSP
jgi:expansin (peptidoglycan-binding protein)